MFNVTGTKEIFQIVLVMLLWCPSVMMASGKFAIKYELGQEIMPHPGNKYTLLKTQLNIIQSLVFL